MRVCEGASVKVRDNEGARVREGAMFSEKEFVMELGLRFDFLKWLG